MTKINILRIYEGNEAGGNNCRILVDRLWPRGISKEQANLDGWWKELAPSPVLRKWFGHNPERWDEFRKKYLQELSMHKDIAREYLQSVSGSVLLLYGAKDKSHTHALVLKEFLEDLLVSDI